MIVPGSANPLIWGGADPIDNLARIERSLRFRSAAVGYLQLTPASAGDRLTGTVFVHIKRGKLGVKQTILTAGDDNATAPYESGLYFDTDDTLVFIWNGNSNGGGAGDLFRSVALFRDPGAHFDIVARIDMGNATRANRCIVEVNGVQITMSAIGSALNGQGDWNNAQIHRIGAASWNTSSPFDGLMSRFGYVDGKLLSASNFGQFHPITGQWRPKSKAAIRAAVASGGGVRNGWGINGYFLTFDDTSAPSAPGYDRSQSDADTTSGSNWAVNNISLTAGPSYDSMVDTPTTNYATLNPLTANIYSANPSVVSNGGLTVTRAAAGRGGVLSSMAPNSGKWYFEARSTNGSVHKTIGIIASRDPYSGEFYNSEWYIGKAGANSALWILPSGTIQNGNTVILSGIAVPATTDILQFAFDADSGKVWIGKNGVWFNSGNPIAGTGQIATLPAGLPFYATCESESGSVIEFNFGQRPFEQAAPVGFKAECAKNLPIPRNSAVVRPSRHMDSQLFTGNGVARSIAGLLFAPDFVWIKARNAVRSHRLFDRLRGVGNRLETSTVNAEIADAQTLTAFNSDGFSLGSSAEVNASGETIVSWNWKMGGNPVANNAGSISSLVSANPEAGLSIVQYTGTGANGRVGHGLLTEPKLILVKSKTVARNWLVYTRIPGMASSAAYFILNATSAQTTGDNTVWGNQDSGSVDFGVGTAVSTNNLGEGYIAYCFAEVEGFSKFGKYAGNGVSDGPFVHCGFRPAFLMWKRADSTSDWVIYDVKRDVYNVSEKFLYPNLNSVEATTPTVDILSNGFKVRGPHGSINVSGATHIFAAFAEFPFRYANAR